jgi:hypothetical protein
MIIDVLTENVLDTVLAIISIVVSVYLIPLIKNNLKQWLEEKRLYNLVQKFVEAAEKLAETGTIPKCDKKKKVIELLEAQGIVVTIEVEAFIESAVKQLDLVTGAVVDAVKDKKTVEVIK